MDSEAIDWEQDLPLDADEAYRSLVRSLRRTDGFGLLFVRCSPAQANQIIKEVEDDLSEKVIKVMQLDESIDNLYDRILDLPNYNQINILFIKGLEYSIYEYEDREYGDINLRSSSEVYSGNWKDVPRILGHLNLNRERFRDNFSTCFVFLIPEFVLQYFIRRAPDFFDWRSNIIEFPASKELVDRETQRFIEDNAWEKYTSLSDRERVERMLLIRSWSSEGCQSPEQKAKLLREYGRLLQTDNKKYQQSLAYFDEAVKLNSRFHEAWNSRGMVLSDLSRYEEAIASYDKALQFKPDFDEAWYNRGTALFNLGRYEEALISYDKALQFKLATQEGDIPHLDDQFQDVNVSKSSGILGDRIEQIKTPRDDDRSSNHSERDFSKPLGKPNYHASYNKLSTLRRAGRYEEASISNDIALQVNPAMQDVNASLSSGIFGDRIEKIRIPSQTERRFRRHLELPTFPDIFIVGIIFMATGTFFTSILIEVIRLLPDQTLIWVVGISAIFLLIPYIYCARAMRTQPHLKWGILYRWLAVLYGAILGVIYV